MTFVIAVSQKMHPLPLESKGIAFVVEEEIFIKYDHGKIPINLLHVSVSKALNTINSTY